MNCRWSTLHKHWWWFCWWVWRMASSYRWNSINLRSVTNWCRSKNGQIVYKIYCDILSLSSCRWNKLQHNSIFEYMFASWTLGMMMYHLLLCFVDFNQTHHSTRQGTVLSNVTAVLLLRVKLPFFKTLLFKIGIRIDIGEAKYLEIAVFKSLPLPTSSLTLNGVMWVEARTYLLIVYF